jgi:hypothetical protein
MNLQNLHMTYNSFDNNQQHIQDQFVNHLNVQGYEYKE